jgi:hypothetical protein
LSVGNTVNIETTAVSIALKLGCVLLYVASLFVARVLRISDLTALRGKRVA